MEMIRKYLLVVSTLLCLQGSVMGQTASKPYEGLKEWSDTREQRMEWFNEARFGMFIHWGLYAAAGGIWKDEVYPQHYSEWIQTWAKIPSEEYSKVLKPQFTAAKFNADEWAKLAHNAGMKYVIITSRHHDGFSIFNSNEEFSKNNPITGGTNISPKGRDLYGELVTAFKNKGMKVGAYYSLLDWQHPDSYEGFQFNENKNNHVPDHEVYKKYMYNQIRELAQNYEAFDVLWPDFSRKDREGEAWGTKKILQDLIQWRPNVLVNNRFWNGLENKNGDMGTPEKYVPPTGLEGMYWEASHTMNESYGYSKHDEKWKSFEKIMRLFVETVSKGGNFLLNVGPDAEGLIPDKAVALLKQVGEWMDVNSESIYGTMASPFSALDWGYATQKKGKLYLHVFDMPEEGKLSLPIHNKIRKIYPLANKKQKLKSKQKEHNLIINIPVDNQVKQPQVLVVEYKGDLKVSEQQVTSQRDGSLLLTADNAKLKTTKGMRLQGASHNNPDKPNGIAGWNSQEDEVSWIVNSNRPGKYKVLLSYLPVNDKSGEVEILVNDRSYIADLAIGENQKEFLEINVGEVELTQEELGSSGIRVILKLKEISGSELPEIEGVKLVPVDAK